MAKTIVEGGPEFPIGRRLHCQTCHHQWELEEGDLDECLPSSGHVNRYVVYLAGGIGHNCVHYVCPKCGQNGHMKEYTRPNHWNKLEPPTADWEFSPFSGDNDHYVYYIITYKGQMMGTWYGSAEQYQGLLRALGV